MHKFFIFLYIFIFTSTTTIAYEDPRKFPDIDPSFIELEISDPNQKVGYTVGDYITRQIKLKVKEPFKLIEESLPIVGYEKRYRGQLLGITLKDIDISKQFQKIFLAMILNLNIKFLRTTW